MFLILLLQFTDSIDTFKLKNLENSLKKDHFMVMGTLKKLVIWVIFFLTKMRFSQKI